MRLLPLAVLVALATLASASQSMTREEALALFIQSPEIRRKVGEMIRGLGLPGSHPLPLSLSDPMQGVRVAIDDTSKLIETVRRLFEVVAEPLKIEYMGVDEESPLIKAKGFIKDTSISKLSTFKVQHLSVDSLNMRGTLALTFDSLDAHGVYGIDATASDQLHVFGDGKFDIRLYQPSVAIQVRLGYDNKHFTLETLSVHVKLSKLKVVMSNLLGGGEVGELVCGIISDVGPAFLEEYREETSQMISAYAKETTNALLAKVDINTIIDWISGGDESVEMS